MIYIPSRYYFYLIRITIKFSHQVNYYQKVSAVKLSHFTDYYHLFIFQKRGTIIAFH
jgi:hypothetical protein